MEEPQSMSALMWVIIITLVSAVGTLAGVLWKFSRETHKEDLERQKDGLQNDQQNRDVLKAVEGSVTNQNKSIDNLTTETRMMRESVNRLADKQGG